MESLIVHPENKEQLSALKTFMTAFKIAFEEKTDDDVRYSQVFVSKINQSDEDFKSGNFKVLKTGDLWK